VLLVERIRRTPGCVLRGPAGLPVLPHGKTLPRDVEEFFLECGGALLFVGAPYPLEIVSPLDFLKANPVIAGVDVPDDPSDDWFIIARNGGQFVTVDCGASRNGHCYDSFWDRHAVAGSCPVVARSFSEFLTRILESRGAELYWLQPKFESLGDAYD